MPQIAWLPTISLYGYLYDKAVFVCLFVLFVPGPNVY